MSSNTRAALMLSAILALGMTGGAVAAASNRDPAALPAPMPGCTYVVTVGATGSVWYCGNVPNANG